ncbi:MAG: hypothetical protein AAF067_04010 [Pseudomonadota bacterium]
MANISQMNHNDSPEIPTVSQRVSQTEIMLMAASRYGGYSALLAVVSVLVWLLFR